MTNNQGELDAEKILAEASNLVASQCICGHARQAHYPKTEGRTLCKDEDCDCLEFEGV